MTSPALMLALSIAFERFMQRCNGRSTIIVLTIHQLSVSPPVGVWSRQNNLALLLIPRFH
jgi:hypothetical protein